jgi:hypothetical protein
MTEQSSTTSTSSAAQLRVTSDLFMQRLDRLYELEQRKREIRPDDPEFTRIAREVEDTARALLGTSEHQTVLADDVKAQVKQGDRQLGENPIRDLPPTRRDATAILGDWRAAERRLAAAGLGSDEERRARDEVERLREEYRDITNIPTRRDGQNPIA